VVDLEEGVPLLAPGHPLPVGHGLPRGQVLVLVESTRLPSVELTVLSTAQGGSSLAACLEVRRFVVGVALVKLWITDVFPGERSIEIRRYCGHRATAMYVL
jgi:hypothetical protein